MPHCRSFLDELVREPVELGFSEWGAPPAPTPPPRSDVQMSPLGGGGQAAHAQAAGEWSGASPVQYSGTDGQQQYASTNGNSAQYARVAAAPGVGAARYGQAAPPAAAGHHSQVCTCGACLSGLAKPWA
jgi:hypothetical protein